MTVLYIYLSAIYLDITLIMLAGTVFRCPKGTLCSHGICCIVNACQMSIVFVQDHHVLYNIRNEMADIGAKMQVS